MKSIIMNQIEYLNVKNNHDLAVHHTNFFILLYHHHHCIATDDHAVYDVDDGNPSTS